MAMIDSGGKPPEDGPDREAGVGRGSASDSSPGRSQVGGTGSVKPGERPGGSQAGGDPADEEQVLDGVFPSKDGRPGSDPGRRVYAVIPEEVISAPPEDFSRFLESIFVEDRDLEESLDGFFASSPEPASGQAGRLRAIVPAELLRSEGWHPAEILDQVFEAFDEIDQALTTLRDRRLGRGRSSETSELAVVPERLLAEPHELARAIEKAHTQAAKLELLFRQARHTLRRLEVYRLSERPPGKLIEEMRQARDLETLQYLIDFLHSIHVAAESFERLELPRVHIRDYLIHLYQMESWVAMSELVERLRGSVMRYAEACCDDRDS